MSRNIKLSKRASLKLEKLLFYLENEWSLKDKNNFIAKFDRSLSLLIKNPDSFPKSEIMNGLCKCIITKQTTVYYRFDDENIYIITIFDNRQNPKKLQKEI